jgi:hypothetical protein
MPIWAAGGIAASTSQTTGSLGYFDPFPGLSYVSTVIGIGTLNLAPIQLGASAAFSSVDLFLSNSYSATNAASSMAHTLSFSLGVFTRNVSTFSNATSTSFTTAFTVTGSSSSASYQGFQKLAIPMALAMTPGDYWFGFISSTASVGNAIAGVFSNVVNSYVGNQSLAIGVFGSSGPFASVQQALGLGQLSVCTAAFPTSFGVSDLVGSGANSYLPVVHFKNFTA